MRRAMQTAILKKSVKVAMILALTVSVGIQTIGFADAKSLLNPISWFAETPTSQEAKIKAEEQLKAREAAQAVAKEAAEAARRAEEAAVEAKRVAEEAAKKAASFENDSLENASKDTVSETSTEEAEKAETKPVKSKKSKKVVITPEPIEEPVQKASKNAPKAGGWHMLNVFDKAEDIKASEAAESTESSQITEIASSDAAPHNQIALLETEKGNIAFELYPEEAPQTVANFVKLVSEGFYNKYNMKFHRVVPGFVVQTGDPTGTGAGGSKQTIPLEAKNKKLSHNAKGIVAMARGFDPNSASSQFYITLTPQPSLDGKYAVFGKVISGISVLDKIEVNDMLYGIRLVDTNTITRDPVEKKGILGFLK